MHEADNSAIAHRLVFAASFSMADQMFTMDRRARWSDSEVSAMLNIIYEMNVAKVLEAKRQRNKDIFKNIEKGMKELGFKKNWDQIRAKWKMLKSTYLAKKKRTSNPHTISYGETSCKYYEQMDHLLQSGVNDSSEFNASDILEVIMNNDDESDNNSSSPREPPQPSPSCSTTSNNSNCDSSIVKRNNDEIINNSTLEASQPSSSYNINYELNTITKNNDEASDNIIVQPIRSCKTKSTKNNATSFDSSDNNEFDYKESTRNLKKRKRSTPYEDALMKFQVSQAKLYRQLQREENEWMEVQLEKMQEHDERLIQAQAEQMKEIMRSFSALLEPILQRAKNNTCNQFTKSQNQT